MAPSNRTLTATVFLLFFLASPPGFATPPDAISLLKAAEDSQVPYQGEVMVTRWFGKQTRAEEVRVYFSPPNRYRWEYLTPDERIKRVVVSDGEREELRLPGEGKVLQGDALKTYEKVMAPERENQLLLKNYSVSLLGVEKIVGRPAWVVELKPLTDGKSRQRLWLDKETGVILENKRYLPGRPFAALSRFTSFEPKKPLPESLFTVTAENAPNVDVHGLDPDFLSLEQLDSALGKRSNFPPELLGGFVFESADFFNIGKHVVRHVRYTDGLTVMSLFQTDRPVRLENAGASEPSPSGWPPGSLHLSSSGKVLSWKQGKRYLTLVGDVSRELLGRIAGKLRKG